MSRKDDSVRCRTRTNSRKVLHCKSLPSERDRFISITKHEKYFRMIPPRKLLLKTVRNFRVVNTTSSKLCFDVAIQAVAYVCRLMTNASVFGDIDAVVSNQWFSYFGHNDCAEQQTITWHISRFTHAPACKLTIWYINLFLGLFNDPPILAQHLLYIPGTGCVSGLRVCWKWRTVNVFTVIFKALRQNTLKIVRLFTNKIVQGRNSNNRDFWKRQGRNLDLLRPRKATGLEASDFDHEAMRQRSYQEQTDESSVYWHLYRQNPPALWHIVES